MCKVAAKVEEIEQLVEIALHQDHLRGIGGDGGCATQRDRKLCLAHGNGVIDAVADEANRPPFLL